MQEASLRLWIALGKYDDSKASLSTYTERVVERVVASLLRKRNAKKRARHDEIEQPMSLIDLQIRVELRTDIDRSLRNLGRFDVRVARLMLRDYKPTEIAKKLGTSRAAIYRSIERIRAAIRQAGYG